MTKSDGEEFRGEDHEELVSCSVGGFLEAREVVDGKEEAYSAEDAVGNFSENH